MEETHGLYVSLFFLFCLSQIDTPPAVFNQRNPLFASSAGDATAELQGYIMALDQGTGNVSTLKNLASFCVAHPSVDAISPLSSSLSMPASPSPFISSAGLLPSLKPELWSENRNFSRLFNALQKFLSPDKVKCRFHECSASGLTVPPFKNEDLLEYGLIVLWEMLEYLTLPMEGHEAEVFTILLTIRYSNHQRVCLSISQPSSQVDKSPILGL